MVSVCLDGYYVSRDQWTHLPDKDAQFAQTEAWATLIALFGNLSQSVLVANMIPQHHRDVVDSRISFLTFLAAQGLPVPRSLVTSDPAAASDFCQSLEGQVVSRTVAELWSPSRPVTPEHVDRLDAIRLSPIHFEALPLGDVRIAAVVGTKIYMLPDRSILPDDLRERCLRTCRELHLQMAEFILYEHQGAWLVSDVRTHISAETLHDKRVLKAAVALLESPPR
jgi:hypothetical protein